MKTNKGFSTILLVIVSLLVLGGGAYYLTSQSGDVPSDTQIVENDNLSKLTTDDLNNNAQNSSMRIVSPNGGEVYSSFNGVIIKWWDDTDAGNKDIYVIDKSGIETPITKDNFLRSSGVDGMFYFKNVDELSDGEYKVKVCKSNNNECDISDNFFIVDGDVVSNDPIISIFKELGLSTKDVVEHSQSLSFEYGVNCNGRKELNGYKIESVDISHTTFMDGGFEDNHINSGDATLHGSSGYIKGSISCRYSTYLEHPEDNYLFCADLNQLSKEEFPDNCESRG